MKVATGKVPLVVLLGATAMSSNPWMICAQTLHEWSFASDSEGFVYEDDIFRDTNEPGYSSGGFSNGALTVSLGGVDNNNVYGISGGWTKDFALTGMAGGVQMVIDYSVDFSFRYELEEYVEVLCSLIDTSTGVLVVEDLDFDLFDLDTYSSEQRTAVVPFGYLSPGSYKLRFGGYNNQKTRFNEFADMFFYNVRLERYTVEPTSFPTFPPARRFTDIFINCGNFYFEFEDTSGNVWGLDDFFDDESRARNFTRKLRGVDNDELYKFYRQDITVVYDIPIRSGRDYDIVLHFAELSANLVDERVFNVSVNGEVKLPNLDIILEVGDKSTPLVKTISMQNVDADSLVIEFISVIDNAVVSAIAIREQLPHFAHAVPGGPYTGVDRNNSGFGSAVVNGDQSHTHAFGEVLTNWRWYVGDQLVATGEMTSIYLPVGVHRVFLDVSDSAGNYGGLDTTVEIKPFGFPFIDILSPDQGLVGNLEDSMTITGVGFTFTESETSVWIGPLELTGPEQITIIDVNTIFVHAVPDARSTAGSVNVTVQTPTGMSAAVVYSFIVDDPFDFDYGELSTGIYGPTVVEFGPDGKLYVATQLGYVYKLTLDDDFNVVDFVVSTAIADAAGINPNNGFQDYRSILGMTFNPSDLKPNPTVYVSHSILLHGEEVAWVGRAVNGKITTLDGANLDEMEDIITGLPVSNLDHAVNGLEFGQDGELYIQVGGNTNAGVPGLASKDSTMVDNYFSSATLVAYLTRPGFDGSITYDTENGDPTGGFGVEVFAPGQRNPFDVVLHSNGFLYGTDNGPNRGFGDKSTGCLLDQKGSPPSEPDELNLLEQGKWYGHANRKRGETDPRQCIWRSVYEESDSDYTAPLALLRSSTNGIIEFQSDHFNGQLRGQLIMSKYKGGLYRGILEDDGRSSSEVVSIPTLSEGGLDLTQAPDGSIFVARLVENAVAWHKPVEAASSDLVVKSAFPRRGPRDGGMKITLYGENFGGSPVVTVGGAACTNVVVVSDKKMTCTTPPGSGNSNIVVTIDAQTATMTIGHRYTNTYFAAVPPTSTPTLAPTGSPPTAPLWDDVDIRTVYRNGDFCPNAEVWVRVELGGVNTPGVRVTLKNDVLGIDMEETTNDGGRAKFAVSVTDPTPGTYSIEGCAYDDDGGGTAYCKSKNMVVSC